jgi:DnaK suppressor protein
LSAEQLDQLRDMLEEQRAFRLDQLAELARPSRDGPLSSPDPEILRSLTAGAHAALRDVESALTRMTEGGYGYCVECHEAIPTARLEVLPQSARCLGCQRTGEV